MGNFHSNRQDRDKGSRSHGSEGPQMHQAQCSKCGKSCLVPFKPTGNRPIFCSECFKTEAGHSDRRTSEPGSTERKMYDAVCDNCGNRCQIPFQPRAGKPVYCSHCFEQREKEGKGFRERPQNNDQFASLNAKLDKILALLSQTEAAATLQKETTTPTEEQVSEEIIKPPKKVTKKSPLKKKTASTKKK